nr:unnamed protein product [Naegleria fowleri]
MDTTSSSHRWPSQRHNHEDRHHQEFDDEDSTTYVGEDSSEEYLHPTRAATAITPSWVSEKKRQRRHKYSSKIRALKQLLSDKNKQWEEDRFKLTLKECSKISTQTLRHMKSDLLRCLQVIDETLHEREDRDKSCAICMGNVRQVVFMPCKHFLSCEDCAQNVEHCPICRHVISKRIKIYLS